MRKHFHNHPLLVSAFLACACLLTTGSASGDRLVFDDGSVVETRGPWKVSGRLLVFHTADGTLSSARVSDVDLEASELATARALAPKPEPRPRPVTEVRPVLVLTDDDVEHVTPEQLEAQVAVADTGLTDPLMVGDDWQEIENSGIDGLAIGGSLDNSSNNVTAAVRLTVRLLDADGAVVAERDARLSKATLQPGESVSFRADFPSVYAYDSVRFETRSHPISLRQSDEEQPANEEEQPASEEDPVGEDEDDGL